MRLVKELGPNGSYCYTVSGRSEEDDARHRLQIDDSSNLAGGAEHIKVAHVVNLPRAMTELKDSGVWITGLDWGDGARPYTEIDFKGRVGLVVGAEGSGISRLVRETCDFIGELPMPGGFESLNASVATAVVMYEVLRQRNA